MNEVTPKDISLHEARERLTKEKAQIALADAMGCVIQMADGNVSKETKTKYVESCVLAFANGMYWGMFWTRMGEAFMLGFRVFIMDWEKAVQAKSDTGRSSEPDWNISDSRYDSNAIEVVNSAIHDLETNFKSLNYTYLEQYRSALYQSIYQLGSAAISAFRGGKSLSEILDTIKELS